VELREIYDIVTWLAGLEEKPEIGTEHALGGYAYPELDLKNIPEPKKKDLGKKLRFVRTKDQKLIRKGKQDYDDIMIDLKSGEEIGKKHEFVDRIQNIGESESGQMLDDQEEEVKQRLEELGYIDR